MKKYPYLLQPLTIRGKTWRNRVVCAPMGGIKSENGTLTEQMLSTVRYKTAGGAAEFIVGETAVSAGGARAVNEHRDFHSPEQQRMLRQLSDTIREAHGALAMIELFHSGAERKEAHSGLDILGPSSHTRPDGIVVKAMDEDDIARVCTEFADAAAQMKRAGFDGVVLHLGHGWLFHQFLSPRTNHRTDAFGGCLENRARLSVMVLRAVREACGEDFLLECRVSGDEHMPGGYSREDLIEFCRMISVYVDVIHISAGLYRDPVNTKMMSCMYDDHGCNVDVAAAVKAQVNCAVCVVGGINSPEQAEDILAAGQADLVALGRELVAEHAFVEKIVQGRANEVRGCLRCMRCFPGPFEDVMADIAEAVSQGKGAETVMPPGCSIEPYYLHRTIHDPLPAQRPLRILVAGGGVAGMQTAITAAQRGHTVLLAEQESELGGTLRFARHCSEKYDLFRLTQTMAAQLRATSAELRLSTPATRELMASWRPDVVVAALGAEPVLPGFLEGGNVLQAMDSYAPDARIGGEAVILGGGLVGCETAVHLAGQGKRVTLIEMGDSLMRDAYRLHRIHVLQRIERLGVTVLLNTKCLGLEPPYVLTEHDGHTEKRSADTVIAALGMRSRSAQNLRAAAEAEGAAFYEVGDCAAPRKIFDAIDEGFQLASSL